MCMYHACRVEEEGATAGEVCMHVCMYTTMTVIGHANVHAHVYTHTCIHTGGSYDDRDRGSRGGGGG